MLKKIVISMAAAATFLGPVTLITAMPAAASPVCADATILGIGIDGDNRPFALCSDGEISYLD